MAQIKGYEGLYDINENGIVTNLKTGNILNGNVNSYGYRVVSLYKDGSRKVCKVHRLLAATFIPNPNNFTDVNHIDGNKLNNSLNNLEWCSRGANTAHARTILHRDFSIKPVVQTTVDGNLIAIWSSATVAARFVGGSAPPIVACCCGTAHSAHGYLWEYAGAEYDQLIKTARITKLEREIERLLQEVTALKNV